MKEQEKILRSLNKSINSSNNIQIYKNEFSKRISLNFKFYDKPETKYYCLRIFKEIKREVIREEVVVLEYINSNQNDIETHKFNDFCKLYNLQVEEVNKIVNKLKENLK